MFGDKYLLLEISELEAEYYHLPTYIPYPKSKQEDLDSQGFDWNESVMAMQSLIKKEDCKEYKLYKLFVKKWPIYKDLTNSIDSKEWYQAEKTADKILAIDLLDPSAYLNLGYIFRVQGKFDQAEQSYTKGLELVKNKKAFYEGLARTYEALGKLEEAIYTWNEIIDFDDNDKNASDKLIQFGVYQKIDNKSCSNQLNSLFLSNVEPGKHFENLVMKEFQRKFDDVDALTKLGLKLVHFHRTELAVKVFERVYQLSSNKMPSNKPEVTQSP